MTETTVKLYTNCEIPAKLFYNEVIGKSNLKALGDGTQKELEDAFMSILDEVCELEKNDELKELYAKAQKISYIQSVIICIENFMFAIKNLSQIAPDEMIQGWIEQLNSIKYIRVRFDVNKGIGKEIERVEKSVLGILRNQIAEQKDSPQQKAERVKMTFEREVLALARITNIRLTDTDSLYYFIELKNMAKEIAKEQKKARNGK